MLRREELIYNHSLCNWNTRGFRGRIVMGGFCVHASSGARACVCVFVSPLKLSSKTCQEKMIWKTHSSARASPPAYLCLDPRSIHIYWSLVWAGADTRTLAADGPLSWQSITATTLEDIRRSHCAQHKRKPRDLGGNVHKELRHHNPNVRLNSWDERVEYCFFLMMDGEI